MEGASGEADPKQEEKLTHELGPTPDRLRTKKVMKPAKEQSSRTEGLLFSIFLSRLALGRDGSISTTVDSQHQDRQISDSSMLQHLLTV